MKPVAIKYSVKAFCPDCKAISLFDSKSDSRELGYILIDGNHDFEGQQFKRIHYRMLQCSGCGRAGLAKFHDNGNLPATLETFHPKAIPASPIPENIPDGIKNEYREAELCASASAWRAASALVRSVLEKTLKANGYNKGTLFNKIDAAATDGIITASRSKRVHDDIRVLGNEVVHDNWREVTEEEVMSSLHYAQRILEDLYDDRETVEKILKEKNKIATSEQ